MNRWEQLILLPADVDNHPDVQRRRPGAGWSSYHSAWN